jgi:hypothetical protein
MRQLHADRLTEILIRQRGTYDASRETYGHSTSARPNMASSRSCRMRCHAVRATFRVGPSRRSQIVDPAHYRLEPLRIFHIACRRATRLLRPASIVASNQSRITTVPRLGCALAMRVIAALKSSNGFMAAVSGFNVTSSSKTAYPPCGLHCAPNTSRRMLDAAIVP